MIREKQIEKNIKDKKKYVEKGDKKQGKKKKKEKVIECKKEMVGGEEVIERVRK